MHSALAGITVWGIGLPHLLHSILETLGIAVGARWYIAGRRAAGEPGITAPGGFAIAAGCLLGALIGSRLVSWIETPQVFDHLDRLQAWAHGQSIVGALLGGLLGIELAKKLTGQRRSTGDHFVFPILLGLMIGRVGCFLGGLEDGTHGLPTGLPWAIDFGDGVSRHPAQLYEIGFCAVLWRGLRHVRDWAAAEPGLLFKLMLSSYLAWRLAIETIKPLPFAYPLGLHGIQWVCLVALAIYLPVMFRQLRRRLS